MSFDLSGRVALVTGSAVGIGRACALALGRAGATAGLHYHSSAQEVEQTHLALQALGAKAVLLRADLTAEEEANAVVDRLVQEAGRLDVLVNNAGSPVRMGPLADCPTDLWRRAFDVN